jgi:hypothetical protein
MKQLDFQRAAAAGDGDQQQLLLLLTSCIKSLQLLYSLRLVEFDKDTVIRLQGYAAAAALSAQGCCRVAAEWPNRQQQQQQQPDSSASSASSSSSSSSTVVTQALVIAGRALHFLGSIFGLLADIQKAIHPPEIREVVMLRQGNVTEGAAATDLLTKLLLTQQQQQQQQQQSGHRTGSSSSSNERSIDSLVAELQITWLQARAFCERCAPAAAAASGGKHPRLTLRCCHLNWCGS